MTDSEKINVIFWIVIVVTSPIWLALAIAWIKQFIRLFIVMLYLPARMFQEYTRRRSEQYWERVRREES